MIVRSKAPLRLGLAGGGTDVSPYCDQYGGYVLNATIDMYAYCTIEPTNTGTVEFYAADMKQHEIMESRENLELNGSLLLHKGVYNRIVKQFCNNKALSLKMTTYSDAPPGSGLGSSSTMVVTILKAYVEWLNLPLGEYDIAQLAYEIERVDLGLSGGKQDQYAATFGGFNFMEFLSNNHVIVNPLRIKRWIKNELEASLVLYYTGTSRDSAKIIDDQIRHTREKNEKSIDAMHQLKKSASVMKEAILKGEFELFAQCLREGWEAKKQTSSVISNPYIEELYQFVMNHGGKAAKISGAGGGGFMMIYCDPIRRYELIKALETLEGKVVQTSFTEIGTQAWKLYPEEKGVTNENDNAKYN